MIFFNDTATTEIYTLSLHDALPISPASTATGWSGSGCSTPTPPPTRWFAAPTARSGSGAGPVLTSSWAPAISEEHTSELPSRQNLVCRLLLDKKNHLLISHYFFPHT